MAEKSRGEDTKNEARRAGFIKMKANDGLHFYYGLASVFGFG